MKERILQIMESEGLTPSAFAEEIGIQRAAMSHITSGRNKPSLDVFTKILDRFAYINPDWLLTGTGNMKRDTKHTPHAAIPPDLFSNPIHIQPEKKNIPEYRREIKDKKVIIPPKKEEKETITFTEATTKKVMKIIIYYSDTTFEIFNPEK